ncbi:conserved hypothetical protein [Lodderomyces elongisporus NRRL YB-4239]|uniref:LicD/FKTN/FKRP nucleotidyltransferase domain-containing protein n=1 Tax=Lodderomyces elongisporus (strain ATCC 11503 / CBS 2605 / JCM 1781 / NBRC 1676 / NRRL YB-4239) TaxID=379508 RepID=A5DW69_LODEL|nr:conserved hypothetical protein [Lodderomyces elongisporus NRRL YB-4239]
MIEIKILKNIFIFVLFINIFYFIKVYRQEEDRIRLLAIKHATSIDYTTDDQIEFDRLKEYHLLDTKQKIAYLLDKVRENQDHHYWLADVSVEQPSVEINPRDYLPPTEHHTNTWQNKSELFYEPRFTLALYLDELKHQLQTYNPQNEKQNDHLIRMPFAWSDWVDLTMLNEEILKPIDERRDCKSLQQKANKKTKYPRWCKNLVDLDDEKVEEIGLARDDMPGFIVMDSPMNKAHHKEVMLQGKGYLLTTQENPISMIFLTKDGTYETQLTGTRERIVRTDLFAKYLARRNIDPTKENLDNIVLNPQMEFNALLNTVPARPLNIDDDIHKMRQTTRQTEFNVSRELHLDKDAFHYRQDAIDEQISDYEIRLNKIEESMTNELRYDPKVIEENRLNRHEINHYNGLKTANKYPVAKEPTYYKLATLKKDKTNKDAGWHYEWRFFNGALRYIKDETWTTEQLEVREQIILDRLLRNWFRFAEEKGIISWIAHGPLLSWYWDGLMFPFDIDIDIQMPSSELNRLSANYNMTLVIEDINEGFGKYLIDCATFLHHRDLAAKDNHIDARFIDVDTGTYIDITGIGINNEKPPPEYSGYIRSKQRKGESVELYMDRRKHWLNFEKISPLHYSMIGGVPVYVPNDVMSMLNNEYSGGTKSLYFDGYYYVPCLRLWLQANKVKSIFKPEQYESKTKEGEREKLISLIKNLDDEGKLRLLELNEDVLIEYYLTHKITSLHEVEKKFMLDHSLQQLMFDLLEKVAYHELTSRFKMGSPLRKSLYDFEYFDRHKHMSRPMPVEEDEETITESDGIARLVNAKEYLKQQQQQQQQQQQLLEQEPEQAAQAAQALQAPPQQEQSHLQEIEVSHEEQTGVDASGNVISYAKGYVEQGNYANVPQPVPA